MSTSHINVMIATRTWTGALRGVAAVSRRAAIAALTQGPRRRAGEVNILLTTDGALRKLNAAYRGKDKATNVLSFPTSSDEEYQDFPATPGGPVLGDIAVAYGVAVREAKAEGKTLKAHVSHLVVHGVLHLLGYDHEHDSDARNMEHLERKILARLGIADPYASDAAEDSQRSLKKHHALRGKHK
jgi:probable rRNA maturation factor